MKRQKGAEVAVCVRSLFLIIALMPVTATTVGGEWHGEFGDCY